MKFLQKLVIPVEGLSMVGYLRVIERALILFLHPEGERDIFTVMLGRIDQLPQLIVGVYLRSRVNTNQYLFNSLCSTRRSSSLLSTGTGTPSMSDITLRPIEFRLTPFVK